MNNFSITSTSFSEESAVDTFLSGYAKLAVDHVMLAIEALGLVGAVLVFLVARHLVTVEKKIG